MVYCLSAWKLKDPALRPTDQYNQIIHVDLTCELLKTFHWSKKTWNMNIKQWHHLSADLQIRYCNKNGTEWTNVIQCWKLEHRVLVPESRREKGVKTPLCYRHSPRTQALGTERVEDFQAHRIQWLSRNQNGSIFNDTLWISQGLKCTIGMQSK